MSDNNKYLDKSIKTFIKQFGFGKIVDLYLEERVRELCEQENGKVESPIEECKIIVTDTFAEVLEKLIISHIRNWNNESDARRPNATIEELAKNRMIERSNNGRIRPMLVQALSEMFNLALKGKLEIVQKNIKSYDDQAKHLK